MIEASEPLRVRLKSGEIRMEPGHPIEFSDEDGSKLLARAPGKVRMICQAGSPITWTRADGSQQTGVIDFLHTDPAGPVSWAFVALPDGSWAAVNMKFARNL